MRISGFEAGEADPIEPVARPTVRLAAIEPRELQPGEHVVERAPPRHQRLGLEHVTGVAIDAGKRFAQHDDAAR